MKDQAPLAILATRPDEIEVISRELAQRALAFVCVGTPEELWATLCETPCIGVAVSIATLIQLPERGKQLIQGLHAFLPVVKFRVNRESGTIGVMSLSQGTGSGFEGFMEACLHRGPKRCRKYERFPRHLNVILAKDAACSEPELSFTFDVSREGCFVHSVQDWNLGDPIWVSIREPFRDFGVAGTIVRCVPWGVPFQPRGVGVRFLDPHNADLSRLIRFLAPKLTTGGPPAREARATSPGPHSVPGQSPDMESRKQAGG